MKRVGWWVPSIPAESPSHRTIPLEGGTTLTLTEMRGIITLLMYFSSPGSHTLVLSLTKVWPSNFERVAFSTTQSSFLPSISFLSCFHEHFSLPAFLKASPNASLQLPVCHLVDLLVALT